MYWIFILSKTNLLCLIFFPLQIDKVRSYNYVNGYNRPEIYFIFYLIETLFGLEKTNFKFNFYKHDFDGNRFFISDGNLV